MYKETASQQYSYMHMRDNMRKPTKIYSQVMEEKPSNKARKMKRRQMMSGAGWQHFSINAGEERQEKWIPHQNDKWSRSKLVPRLVASIQIFSSYRRMHGSADQQDRSYTSSSVCKDRLYMYMVLERCMAASHRCVSMALMSALHKHWE